jgi:hypothetical protein
MNDTTHPAIGANLTALRTMLVTALDQVDEAQVYMKDGNVNAAIGSVTGLDQLLADAKALFGAATALHRWRG